MKRKLEGENNITNKYHAEFIEVLVKNKRLSEALVIAEEVSS